MFIMITLIKFHKNTLSSRDVVLMLQTNKHTHIEQKHILPLASGDNQVTDQRLKNIQVINNTYAPKEMLARCLLLTNSLFVITKVNFHVGLSGCHSGMHDGFNLV